MFNELFFLLAILSAMFVYMLDYGLGRPGDQQPNYSALLFGWSFFIAKKTLQNLSAWDNLQDQYIEQMKGAVSPKHELEIKKSFREIVFNTARPLFSWQNIAGMCPICTHFWITFFLFLLVNIFYQKENIFIFGLYFCFSHLLIRIFKRI